MIKAHLLRVPRNNDVVFDVYFETFDLWIGSLLNGSGLRCYWHFLYRSTVLQLDRDMATLLINLSRQQGRILTSIVKIKYANAVNVA